MPLDRPNTPKHDPDTMAASTAEQVRGILEAAQQAADRLRTDAGAEAREHVERVSAAAGVLLERVEALEAETSNLLDGLRVGASRLFSDLVLLQDTVGDLRDATAGLPADLPGTLEPEPQPAPEELPEDPAAPAAQDPEPAERPADEAPEPAERPADEEGARLVALNLALSGRPREEVEAHLAEAFDLEDPAALLDDVYARTGG